MGIRSAVVLMVVFTAFLPPAQGEDLMHQITDAGTKTHWLQNYVEKTVLDDSVRSTLRQARDALDSGVINKAGRDIANVLSDLEWMVTSALERARELLMSLPVPGTNLTLYINLVTRYWRIIAEIILIILILFLLKARLPALFSGPDWSMYTTEDEIKKRCIEPLLEDWKISYLRDRPCKLKQGNKTVEGKIDYYLYDDDGAITIIEDKNTINGEEAQKSARAQARSCCIGLYIFESIAVNSFVIASREGLWIYRMRHNEDYLVERVSPKKLNGSKKRQIKDKLLEIR
jgi:hypothetical protein